MSDGVVDREDDAFAQSIAAQIEKADSEAH